VKSAKGLGIGTTIAAAAAIVLLISMFLDWFALESISAEGNFDDLAPGVSDPLGSQFATADVAYNAWEAFEAIDVVLALAIAAAAILTGLKLSGEPAPTWLRTSVGVLGLLAAVLIAYRIISPPELLAGAGETAGVVEIETDVGREPWLFVGLAAAAGIAFGGWRAMQEGEDAPPPPVPAASPVSAPPPTGR
jgi:hypothetical protein